MNESDGIAVVGSTGGLCALLDALKKGEQLVTPDPSFGVSGCHGLELYRGTFYAKGVGAPLGDRTGEWLKDLVLRPEAWMTWSAFKAQSKQRK